MRETGKIQIELIEALKRDLKNIPDSPVHEVTRVLVQAIQALGPELRALRVACEGLHAGRNRAGSLGAWPQGDAVRSGGAYEGGAPLAAETPRARAGRRACCHAIEGDARVDGGQNGGTVPRSRARPLSFLGATNFVICGKPFPWLADRRRGGLRMRIRGDYPATLVAAWDHAARFGNMIHKLDTGDANVPVWVRGRFAELRTVATTGLRARREQQDEDVACAIIVGYVVVLHRKAGEKLGRHNVFLVLGRTMRSGSGAARADGGRTGRLAVGVTTTMPSPRQDRPEMIKRVREEMPRVEVHARALKQRVGDACPGGCLCVRSAGPA